MALCVWKAKDFLDLWRGVLPVDYTEPIESDGGVGFDIPSAQARMWERVDQAVNLSTQAMFFRPHSAQSGPVAAFGRRAQGAIEVYRAAPAVGDLLARAGQFLVAEALDSVGGTLQLGRLQVVEDTILPEGSGGPIAVEVEAEFAGYDGNQWEGVVVRFEDEGRLTVPAELTDTNQALRSVTILLDGRTDRFHEGLIGRFVRFVSDTPLVSLSVPRRVTGIFTSGDQLGIEFTPAIDAADIGAVVTVEVEELSDFGVSVLQPEPITGGVTDTLRALGVDRNTQPTANESEEGFRNRCAELPDVVSPAAIRRICDRVLGPVGVSYCLHETRDVDGLMGFTWDIHPYDAPFGLCSCDVTKPPGSELVGHVIVWLNENTLRRFFMICVSPNAVDHLPEISALWHEVNAARAAGVAFVIALSS